MWSNTPQRRRSPADSKLHNHAVWAQRVLVAAGWRSVDPYLSRGGVIGGVEAIALRSV